MAGKLVLIRMSLLHRKGQKNPKKKKGLRRRKKNHHFNLNETCQSQAGETKKRSVMERFTEGLWQMMNGKMVRMIRVLRL